MSNLRRKILADETSDKVRKAIDEYKVKYKNSFKNVKDGTIEYYRDYRDNLDEFPFDECETYDDFLNIIDDMYLDASGSYDSIVEDLNLDPDFIRDNYEEIIDALMDSIFFVPPDFGDDKIKVDLFYKGNTKYKYLDDVADIVQMDSMFNSDDEGNITNDTINVSPALLDFMELFGYSKDAFINSLNKALNGEATIKFIKQTYEELYSLYGYNVIAFCGEITVKEYFDFKEAIKNKDSSVKINIPKNTDFLFFDRGSGSGSDFIPLPKSLSLPASVFYSIDEKDSYKYNIDDVYGLVSSVWTDSTFTVDSDKITSSCINKARKVLSFKDNRKASEKAKGEKKARVRDWYVSNYPHDTLAEKINKSVTFEDIFEAPADVYDLLGVSDSLIRENIFHEIANIYYKGDYSKIYQRWLGN